MIITFMMTLCVLAISLYGQARLAAREIRRHRADSADLSNRNLVLGDGSVKIAQPDVAIAAKMPANKWRILPRIAPDRAGKKAQELPVPQGLDQLDISSFNSLKVDCPIRYQSWLEPSTPDRSLRNSTEVSRSGH
jgi:hypothetical protein